MHKDIESILVCEKEIENIVKSIAKQIEKDYNCKEFIMIGLLKGSMTFMADHMRKIHLDFPVDFIIASSYNGTQSTGKIQITKDIDCDISGKDILIVEDIIDTGRTLEYIKQYLISKKAKTVRICTLFDKPDRRQSSIVPDYTGMIIPDKFIVGYGLDYNELYRNLPYVGILSPSVYT